MEAIAARQSLDRLIRKSGETYASISRLIGRNPAYIQQYIRRGVPGRLEETDLRTIARALSCRPADIGAAPDSPEPVVGRPAEATRPTDYVLPDSVGHRSESHSLAFHAGWVAALASGRIEALALLRVEDDSMLPALTPGDQMLIDRDDAASALRDGLYALRLGGALSVKRLAVHPASRRVAVLSDNPAYPAWDDVEPGALEVIGRVVWAGRRFL